MKKRTIIVAGLIASVLVFAITINYVQALNSKPEEYGQWVVQRGDTLWGIAAENRGYTEIRKYIYQIQKLNDIGPNIHPGQVLLLPPGK